MDGGKTGRAFLFGVAIGGLSWGFGYFGQPHLLTRYMAIRNVRDLRQGTLIAMSWVLLAYWGSAFIGLCGIGVLGPDLVDPEQVMPLLARALVPAWMAGILISGAVAAMMSTADSQLLVATSSLVEDLTVKLLGKNRDRGWNPATLVLLSRLGAILITGIALFLAFVNSDLVFDMVAYAWSGLGSSFGPVILLTLWWSRTTRGGVLAGMVTGMSSTILWRNSVGLQEALDIKAASFLLAITAVIVFSLLGVGARRERTESYGKHQV